MKTPDLSLLSRASLEDMFGDALIEFQRVARALLAIRQALDLMDATEDELAAVTHAIVKKLAEAGTSPRKMLEGVRLSRGGEQ